jgi:hypothetical protein
MDKKEANESMKVIDGQKAVNFIIDNAEKFAEAHSNRVHLENMTKVIRARLIQDCKNEPVTRAESYALSHPDYLVNIDGIKAAMYQEDRLKWLLEAAKLRAELARTMEASRRHEERMTR